MTPEELQGHISGLEFVVAELAAVVGYISPPIHRDSLIDTLGQELTAHAKKSGDYAINIDEAALPHALTFVGDIRRMLLRIRGSLS